MNQENCPCCGNHCEKDSLRCDRGRNYFEGNVSHPDSSSSTIEDNIIMKLRECGHMLHHKKEVSSSDMLSNFSQDQLNQLYELLSKIGN